MSCSLDPKAARSAPLYLAILFLALFNASTLFAQDLPEARETQVWLVTYGPGEIYWQRFGHNAIWIRDRERGLDHAFNFGFFDFEQENFFLRFLQGRMLYFSAARPAQDEFTAYINENRSIRAQRLDLSVDQKEHLTRFLLNEIKPENRDYLYDYYRNNCSTRVRDALDMGLGGLLREKFEPLAGAQTWREHTRRLTVDDFWLYLGLEIVLGATIDREIDRWDELFIPSELAGALTGLRPRRLAGAVRDRVRGSGALRVHTDGAARLTGFKLVALPAGRPGRSNRGVGSVPAGAGRLGGGSMQCLADDCRPGRLRPAVFLVWHRSRGGQHQPEPAGFQSPVAAAGFLEWSGKNRVISCDDICRAGAIDERYPS